MEAERSPDFEASLKQKYYNLAQICLFQYMQLCGEVKDWADYSQRIAPCFEMLANGVMEFREKEIEDLRAEVKKVTKIP